jgi:cytochrome c peroxidase
MSRRLLILGVTLTLLVTIASQALATSEHRRLRGAQRASLVDVGRTLFFDPRFSQDGTVSCASCHRLENAFADSKVVAQGVQGRRGTRNTPSLRNATYTQATFWDGRRPNLESQVLDPFFNPNEHGLHDHAELLCKLEEGTGYHELWQNALGLSIKRVKPTDIAQALSAYVRSLKQTKTRLDRYLFR